ncbi:MAG: hypothetical protein K1X55_12310 [Chitinophagales bacterium]|nr:hypothetical protein [Chitinophagales bacterium]
MKRLLIILVIFSFLQKAWGIGLLQVSPTKPAIEKKTLVPCVQALLNDEPILNGGEVSQDAQGTLTVENNSDQKVYFNITLKTNLHKKNEPPIYLRFVKLSKLDIRKVLDYAKAGDEIYIEQFISTQGATLKCAPSSFIIT